MSGFPHLPISSLAAKSNLLNYSVISSVLALLGWQDKRSVLTEAEEKDRVLANDLQAAYAAYLTLPDQSSISDLKISLVAVINKLEKDRLIAARLAQEANSRLRQEKVGYFNNGMTTFISGLTTTLKTTLFGSEDAARGEHYNKLVAKYTVQLENLSRLSVTLQQSAVGVAERGGITVQSNNQRRLLQANASTLPKTQQDYCYPNGACDLSSVVSSGGVSGFVLQGELGDDRSGTSVSNAGDVNGDGLADMLIGAYMADPSGRIGAGKTYVIFGSHNTTVWDPGALNISSLINGQGGFVLQGETAGDESGTSVRSAGDVNGDGLADILIGAPKASSGAGKTYVIFGSRNTTAWASGVLDLGSLINGQSGFVLQGRAGYDEKGTSVSSAGDMNGDGLADILIGAPQADPLGRTNAGKTYVVFGSRNTTAWGSGVLDLSSLINGQRGFVLQGELGDDRSGTSVSSAGDVNGDELADILIGVPNAFSNVGKTYVIFGSRNTTAWGSGVLDLSSLINGQRGFVLQGQAAYDESATSVSSAGDVNGDELADILIGAPQASPLGKTNAGKTYVIFGSRNTTAWGSGVLSLSSLINGQRGFVLQGETDVDRSGCSVSSAGDVNGDGLADMLIGAYGASKTYVVFGSRNTTAWGTGVLDISSLINGQRGFVLKGVRGQESGSSVSLAGTLMVMD